MTSTNAPRTRIFRDAAGRCYRWQQHPRTHANVCIRRCATTAPFAFIVRRQSKKQRLAARRAAQ